jgi:HEPN domain-containing protein
MTTLKEMSDSSWKQFDDLRDLIHEYIKKDDVSFMALKRLMRLYEEIEKKAMDSSARLEGFEESFEDEAYNDEKAKKAVKGMSRLIFRYRGKDNHEKDLLDQLDYYRYTLLEVCFGK